MYFPEFMKHFRSNSRASNQAEAPNDGASLGDGHFAPSAKGIKSSMGAIGSIFAKPNDASPKDEEQSVPPPMVEGKLAIFAGCRSAVVSVAVLSFFINLLMLTGPVFMLQVYDRVLASGSIPTLVGLAFFVAIAYSFYIALEAIRGRVLGRISAVFDARVSPEAYRMSFDNHTREEATSKDPVGDLDRIRSFVAGQGLSAIFDLPWIPIYMTVIFLFHPLLGAVATTGAVIVISVMLLNTMVTKKKLSALTEVSGERDDMTKTAQNNSEVIIGMGMIESLTERWRSLNGRYMGLQTNVADFSSMFQSITKGARLALQSGMLAMGAYLAILQEITPGVMIAASIISARALAPVEQAVAQWRHFINARISFARLQKLFAALVKHDVKTQLPFPEKDLAIKDLFISPPQNPRQILLRGVNFEVEAGDGLGILGPSGSGKTTLGRAIAGVWAPIKGTIRADAVTLDQWSIERRGQFTGYLPQDIQIFNGTIAENISRFKPNVEAKDIIEAAKLANAHELIVSFPDGYDTVVGSAGSTLSGGQLQRIGLARAFFGMPFIIVLDEPNSNLDGVGEEALQDAIMRMRARGSIVTVITHRPKTLAATNKLLVLDKGAQRSFGSKEEILPTVTAPRQGGAPQPMPMQGGAVVPGQPNASAASAAAQMQIPIPKGPGHSLSGPLTGTSQTLKRNVSSDAAE